MLQPSCVFLYVLYVQGLISAVVVVHVPYIVAFSSILPDSHQKNRQKTRVVKRTANPVFNHTMVYGGLRPEDLRDTCVELTVWDHDRLSNHFIGGTRLSLGTGWRHLGLISPLCIHSYRLNYRSNTSMQYCGVMMLQQKVDYFQVTPHPKLFYSFSTTLIYQQPCFY